MVLVGVGEVALLRTRARRDAWSNPQAAVLIPQRDRGLSLPQVGRTQHSLPVWCHQGTQREGPVLRCAMERRFRRLVPRQGTLPCCGRPHRPRRSIGWASAVSPRLGQAEDVALAVLEPGHPASWRCRPRVELLRSEIPRRPPLWPSAPPPGPRCPRPPSQRSYAGRCRHTASGRAETRHPPGVSSTSPAGSSRAGDETELVGVEGTCASRSAAGTTAGPPCGLRRLLWYGLIRQVWSGATQPAGGVGLSLAVSLNRRP